MATVNTVYEYEGDSTQALGSFQYRSRVFRGPRRWRPGWARVMFAQGDLVDYWAEVEARDAIIKQNLEIISEGNVDGASGQVGGGFIFATGTILGGNNLQEVPSVPVYAGVLSLTMKIYKDGTLVATIPIYHDRPFRTGVSGKHTKWEYELIGNVEKVTWVDLASSVKELRAEPVQEQ